MAKYVDIETRATDPWASGDYAVAKAYPKMLDDMPTLPVIKDDVVVSLADRAAMIQGVGPVRAEVGVEARGRTLRGQPLRAARRGRCAQG